MLVDLNIIGALRRPRTAEDEKLTRRDSRLVERVLPRRAIDPSRRRGDNDPDPEPESGGNLDRYA